MGACAEREVYFERESVKDLRTRMVVEYLKHKDADLKGIRNTVGATSRKEERGRRRDELQLEKVDLRKSENPYRLDKDIELEMERADSAGKTPKFKIGKESQAENEGKKGEVKGEEKKQTFSWKGVLGAEKKEPVQIQNKPIIARTPSIDNLLPAQPENQRWVGLGAKNMREIDIEEIPQHESESVCSSPGKSVFSIKDQSFVSSKDKSPSKSPPLSFPQNPKPSESFPPTLGEDSSPKPKPSLLIPLSNPPAALPPRELKLQTTGLNIKPRAVELSVSSAYSQVIPPAKLAALVEPKSTEDDQSLRFLFRMQVPKPASLSLDHEPYHPIIISKDYIITDHSNRPASPRIDCEKVKFRSRKFAGVLSELDYYIPQIPVCDTRLSNPFHFTDRSQNADEKSEEAFEDPAEPIQLDREIAEGNLEFAKELSEKLNMADRNSSATGKIDLNDARISDRYYIEKKNSLGVEFEVREKQEEEAEKNEEGWDQDFFITPAVEIANTELDDELKNRISGVSNYDAEYQVGTRLGFIVPERKSYSPEYGRNPIFSPNMEEDYSNRVDSPEFYRPQNREDEGYPMIRVFKDDRVNTSFNENDSVRIPDIRASLNSSALMFRKKHQHYLRKSPQRLTPELFKKNLEGKLTADEELKYRSRDYS
jgi:hypothetical protein